MPLRVVLDPHSENTVEDGAIEITDELSFLKSLNSSGVLFVKGRFLCHWASNVARARGWVPDWRSAPSSELRQACPLLSEEQAKAFLARFADLSECSRPLSLLELVVDTWPELDPVGKCDAEQAWSWLVWRARTDLEADEEIVAATFASSFLSHEPELKALLASEKEDAWKRIKEWLRCERGPANSLCQDYLEPLDWILERLTGEWRLEAVRRQGAFFFELLNLGAPSAILQRASFVLCGYLRQNSSHITPELLAAIKPFVAFREWSALRDLLPAKDPGLAPTRISEVLSWFSESYVNYRLSANAETERKDRMREIGREFGLWYLAFYANARTGGEGRELMSWSKTAQLSDERSGVKLLAVLDGLGYIDAKQLTEFITSECRRLALDEFETILAPLPTVTHFAKPSLMAGVTPVQAFEEKEIGAIETRDSGVINALNQANVGDVVIWSVLEPDMTYHKALEAQATFYEVEGRLRSIAKRIARIVNGVADSQKLRLIITTDHGRLLSPSQRLHQVPHKMQAHGRAAWGQVSAPFDGNGIFVEGAIAYIDPARFGLPETAAIILTDDAFLTSDGRSGIEPFTHGGVFPEEVLIPWVRFTRDRGPLNVHIRLTGRGQAGAAGKLSLEISNTSEIRIEVVQILMSFLVDPIDAHVSVGALGQSVAQWTVSNWPRKADVSGVRATVVCTLPTGERQSFAISPILNVEEMYSRDTALDELL